MATSTEFSKPLNQDMSEKADKVSGATNGDFAGLDSNGNLTDSGKKASDFVGTSSFYATNIPMSSSDSTKVSTAIANKIKVVTLEKTVNNGYFAIDINTDIGNGYSIGSINTVYKSGTTSDQLNLCYTIDRNNVYVRTGSGNQLANGTVINVLVLGIK